MANVFKDILNKLNLTDDEDDFEDEGYDWDEKPAKKGKRIIEEEDDSQELDDGAAKRRFFSKKDSDEDSYEDMTEQKEAKEKLWQGSSYEVYSGGRR